MKILKYIFFIIFLCFFSISKANQVPVDFVFKDINKNYKYYNELQSLYDRWIIFPDENWNFDAKKNLTRDEFVWIVSEISCSECIKPNVDFELTKKHSDKKIFFDVENDNKFFYCIADSVEKWRVTGYQEWTVCQNWTSKPWEKPFCPENNIILEEALAIILRSGNILSIDEAEKIRKEIASWVSYPNILNISPKLGNGSVYSFYPDFKKAYEYTFLDFDKNWVEKKLKLWDFGNTIDTKKFVTREDFLRISYIALKNNSCKPKSENKFWLKIEVLDKVCTKDKENCEITNFPDSEKIFDLRWQISAFDKSGFTYSWRIYDYQTGKYSNASWDFIDNYDFKKDWKYRVFLTAENPKIWKSEVFTDIVLKGKSEEKIWDNNLEIIVSDSKCSENIAFCEEKKFPNNDKIFDINGKWGFSDYTWTITNTNTWKTEKFTWQTINDKIFDNWTHKITLTSTDVNWNKIETSKEITIWGNNDDNSGLKIKILNPNCSEDKNSCKEESFPTTKKIFDIQADWWNNSYTWTITNKNNWKTETFTWSNIDNKNFEEWTYEIKVTSKDKNWKDISTTRVITILGNNDNNSNNSWITSNIVTDKIRVTRWEPINFTWVTNAWNDASFNWNFWDWKTGNWKDISHNFPVNWTYTVTLVVTDKDWKTSTSTVNIIVSNTPWFEWNGKDSDWDWVPDDSDNEINTPADRTPYICKLEHIEKKLYGCKDEDLWVYNPKIEEDKNSDKDSDDDGVLDKNDLCKDIKWDKNNFWCPILEKTCKVDSDCKEWYFCENGYCKAKKHNLNCAYNWKNVIIWKAECNSCPCNVNLDFNATLRSCDIVFPAITSPDHTDIYSKGKYFQIKKVEN